MLQAMQQTEASAPAATAHSFAGMLAALTAPAPKPTPAWNDDDLEDDVTTLSYEHALLAHGRYRAFDPPRAASYDRSLTQAATPESDNVYAHARAQKAVPVDAASATPEGELRSSADTESEIARRPLTQLERNLKDASVTIRLSKAECEQLHQRAAEAGLTVSAYLRSCTFEAETLRAMVKDTLAQLRSATSTGEKTAAAPSSRARFGWLKRLLPRRIPSQRVARA
jgi:predicted DNA binding CopG/RHH family protein